MVLAPATARLLAAGVAFTASMLVAVPASAADLRGAIASVVPTADGLRVEFRGYDLPPDARVDRDSVRVLLDGEPVQATARPLADRTGEQQARRVALVLDASGSMAGRPLEAARAAATAYVGSVPTDVEVALVAFSGTPRVLVEPTLDRGRVQSALAALEAGGRTSLYDAVVKAGQVLGNDGDRRMLVLSDGNDSSSAATLDATLSDVRRTGVEVDAVALGKGVVEHEALTRVADAGRGRVLAAEQDVDLGAAFTEAARVFTAGVVLDVPAPAERAGEIVALQVDARTNTGAQLGSSATVIVPEGPASEGFLANRVVLGLGLLAVFVGLALAVMSLLQSDDGPLGGRRRTQQMLAAYSLRPRPQAGSRKETSRIGTGHVASAALQVAGRLLDGRQLERRLTARLERADVRFTAREWLVVQAALAVIPFTVLVLVANAFVAVAGAALAVVAAGVWLAHKGSRRAAAFEAEMPDALQLVASGLSTGYSLPQALDSVVRDGRPPVGAEFGRALAEARLGVPLEDSLDTVAERMDSQDFRWVVMAIRVQRDVGGNLSDVLSTVCNTMRERGALRRQVKALSAEGRMSALILVLLPIVLAAYLALVNPTFFAPMWQTTVGLFLLGGSAVALAVGAVWMRKLAKVEM